MNNKISITGWVLLALVAIIPAHAQLTLGPTVTASAGTFHYDYTVSNKTPNEQVIVTLSGLLSGVNTVKNLTSPAGFEALYDSGLGLLSFFEDTSFFTAGSVIGKFSFDSPYAPGPGGFESLDVAGNLTIGSSLVPTSPVPEPSTTAIAGALLLIGLAASRKFYRSESCT